MPSNLSSVPAYFPYNTVSPTLTVIGSSFVPFPIATTLPFWGFSFALSGIIIPEAVVVSAATGSIRMGKQVAQVVGARLGKTILELGGNNAIIVSEHADTEMAIRATVFGACGTAGQRCTSLGNLILHKDIYDEFMTKFMAKVVLNGSNRGSLEKTQSELKAMDLNGRAVGDTIVDQTGVIGEKIEISFFDGNLYSISLNKKQFEIVTNEDLKNHLKKMSLEINNIINDPQNINIASQCIKNWPDKINNYSLNTIIIL